MKNKEAKPTHIIDARGHLCPLPVLKLRKKLQSTKRGERVEILTSDPVAAIDIPHFCAAEGHELIASLKEEFGMRFTIERIT